MGGGAAAKESVASSGEGGSTSIKSAVERRGARAGGPGRGGSPCLVLRFVVGNFCSFCFFLLLGRLRTTGLLAPDRSFGARSSCRGAGRCCFGAGGPADWSGSDGAGGADAPVAKGAVTGLAGAEAGAGTAAVPRALTAKVGSLTSAAVEVVEAPAVAALAEPLTLVERVLSASFDLILL